MNIFSKMETSFSNVKKGFTNNDEKTKYEDEIYNLYKDVWAYYNSYNFRYGITINIGLLYTLEEPEKIENIEKILAMETQYQEFMKRLNDFEKDVRRELYRKLKSIDDKLTDIKDILFFNRRQVKPHSIIIYLEDIRKELYKIKKTLFSNQTLEEHPSIKIYLENLQETGNPTKSYNSYRETEDDYRNTMRWKEGGKPKKTRRHKNKKRRSSKRHKK